MSSSRRYFLQAAALTPAAGLSQVVSPNDKIRFATIGMGGMGTGDTESALKTGLTEMVAVADIYQGRLDRAKERFGNHLYMLHDKTKKVFISGHTFYHNLVINK